MLKCLLCDALLPPRDRIRHAAFDHGLNIDEITNYSIFGKDNDEHTIPEVIGGMCGSCEEYLSTFDIVATINADYGIFYLIRCGVCSKLSIAGSKAELNLRSLEGYDEEAEQEEIRDDLMIDVVIHKGARCYNCRKSVINPKYNKITCLAFDSEVFIDPSGASMAESCEDYEKKIIKKKEDKQ